MEKVGKKEKRGYKIPLYKGTTPKEIKEYLDMYGKYCLFYSITGFTLGSSDCVVLGAQQEFKVGLNFGFDYLFEFTNRIHNLNRKIQKIVMDKYKVDVLSDKQQWVFNDNHKDKRIVSGNDLFYIRPCYTLMNVFLTKPHIDVINDDDRLLKHYVSIFGDDNINEFPTAMSERLKFLFNNEIEKEYASLIEDFQMV